MKLLKPMKTNSKLWDTIGIGLSLICVVHCIVTPVILSLLPVLGQLISEDAFHTWMAPVFIVPAILALIPGTLKHKSKLPIVLAVFGLIVFCLSTFLHGMSESVELIASLVGSGMLIAAHKLNHTYCNSCVKCEDEEGHGHD